MYKRLTLSPWATTMDCPSGLTLQKFYFERVPLEELLLIYLLCTRVLYFCLQGLALLFWIVILNNKRWTQKTYTQIKTPSEDRWFYFSAVATWPAIFLQPSYGSQQRGDHCSQSAEEIAAIMKVDADATAHLMELSIILHLFAKIMWKCIEIGIRHQLQMNHKLNTPSLLSDVAIYWCVETNIERGKGGSKCPNKLYRSVTREIHTVNVSIMSPRGFSRSKIYQPR